MALNSYMAWNDSVMESGKHFYDMRGRGKMAELNGHYRGSETENL